MVHHSDQILKAGFIEYNTIPILDNRQWFSTNHF